MKKSDLMRNLLQSKNIRESTVSNKEDIKATEIFNSSDRDAIVLDNEENLIQPKSTVIEYIKKRIVKIRN